MTTQEDRNDGTSIRVSLVLRDFDVPPAEITRMLKISPSRTSEKGARFGEKSSRTHAHTSWAVASELPSTASLETQIASVLQRVEPDWPALRDLTSSTKRQVYCTVIPGGAIPLLELSAETLERLARLRLQLVIDVLHVHEEDS